MISLDVRRSSRLSAAYPDLEFAAVFAEGVDPSLLAEIITTRAREVQALSSSSMDSEVISRLNSFEEFFRNAHQSFPLTSQIKSVGSKGFPKAPPQVLSLLVAETATGILMGVQDATHIEGYIELDVVEHPESFQGMRQVIHCVPGEIVVRDGKSIVAAYFQGPDKRTAVTPGSTDLLYYVFSVPSRPECALAGAAWICDLLTLCSERATLEVATGAGDP